MKPLSQSVFFEACEIAISVILTKGSSPLYRSLTVSINPSKMPINSRYLPKVSTDSILKNSVTQLFSGVCHKKNFSYLLSSPLVSSSSTTIQICAVPHPRSGSTTSSFSPNSTRETTLEIGTILSNSNTRTQDPKPWAESPLQFFNTSERRAFASIASRLCGRIWMSIGV